jgi:hypothetical protein
MYELQKYYMQCMDHLLVMNETQSGITIGDDLTNTTPRTMFVIDV